MRHMPSVRAAVVVTSDKCYENQDWERGYVETDPFGGHDPYSGSKGAAEIAAASMRRSFFSAPSAAAVATARAGNVIGAGDWSAHRIVPDCIRALRAGEPVVLRNPSAVRPWQHVLDALHGYLVLGGKLLTDGHRYTGGWNFGPTPRGLVPVRDLVDTVIKAWGEGRYEIEASGAARPAEARFLHLDSTKAQTELGWAPRLELRDAVKMTVDGYRAESSAAPALYAHRVEQIRTFRGLS
ncbi:MAG TPA: GDP-mannose 4,6-dehydratase, partial [Kofleriaceae bacterium]